jgi:hypothetical protein
VCQLLLQHGVKIERTNSVKRTAAQMAAFVGQFHEGLFTRTVVFVSRRVVPCRAMPCNTQQGSAQIRLRGIRRHGLT